MLSCGAVLDIVPAHQSPLSSSVGRSADPCCRQRDGSAVSESFFLIFSSVSMSNGHPSWSAGRYGRLKRV
jgi:hypothetical protein